MLEREYQFIYEITAGEVDDTLKPPFSEERILIQGIADAVFIEDGELVIVDYKTDRMRNPSDFAEKYADQLRIYKEALRQYFELPVKGMPDLFAPSCNGNQSVVVYNILLERLLNFFGSRFNSA